jgi:hypothetical protein
MEPVTRRRILGTFCLLAALFMLVSGETFFKNKLSLIGYLVYWVCCFAFTIAAIIIAFRDVRAIGRNVRKDHRELFDATLREIEADVRNKRGGNGTSPGRNN